MIAEILRKLKKEDKEQIKKMFEPGASVEHPVDPSISNPFTEGAPEQEKPEKEREMKKGVRNVKWFLENPKETK